AVRRGRRAEFASFAWEGEIPDPQDPLTCERSCIHVNGPLNPRQAALLRWTRQLIELRTTVPSLGTGGGPSEHHVWTYEQDNVLVIHRRGDQGPDALLILSFNGARTPVLLREPGGHWRLRLGSTGQEGEVENRERPPQEMVIMSEGAALSLEAYTAAVYLRVA
ncbi:MAG: DUF3459 domain-containing protein, partial [Nitrospirae bacterium]|nr:DUF3459 domain-containing protein [Nitrospirota bacterium]